MPSEASGAPTRGQAGAEHLDEYGGDSRPPVYWDAAIERWVYRAYALGNCIRALAAFRQGVTPAEHPEWLLKAFGEGHRNESVILDLLYAEGKWVPVEFGAQQELGVEVGSQALIRGHNDDVAIVRQPMSRGIETRVVEAKAFVLSTYKKWVAQGWDAFPYYAVQLSIYMHALQLPALFVIGLKDETTRVVERIEVFPIDEPPVSIAKIKARVSRIENAAGMPGCDFNQYPCQMFFLGDENGCGGGAGMVGHDGRRLPKPTSKKRLEEIDLEAQLRDSVALERLNTPAEAIFEGTRKMNHGSHLMREGEREVLVWEDENFKLAGDTTKVRKYQTTKWHITVHPVGGIAVRPRRDPIEMREGP